MDMNQNNQKTSFLKKIWLLMLAFGPGIFCIGYTIGTGSVTSMAKAGSQYGMQLLWVLALSAFFAGIMMEAYGRYAVVTGETAIHSIRKKIKYGKFLAIAIVIGVVAGQWNSLTGILGISANAIYELVHIFFPATSAESYWVVLGIAIFIIVIFYGLLLKGNYSFFEKVLIIFVTLMGISFIISMFIVMPPLSEIASGLNPTIPKVPGGKLMVAAFVGTTMAAPTFLVRPLLMKGKGWGIKNTREQTKDAIFSAVLMFVISGAIMVTATGALFHNGKTIEKVLDMVLTLEPLAGRFSVLIFVVGTLSAGLSSVFPILMVAPLLIADYRNGELDTNLIQFKRLTAIAAVVGLIVPVMGANPISAQIATQVANVFVLPLIVGSIIYLVNNKKDMGEYRAGYLLNAGMILALIFSCFIAYNGVISLYGLIQSM